MRFLAAVFILFASVSNSEELNNAPGTVVFWSPNEGKTTAAQYRTQSMVVSLVNGMFDDEVKAREIVVLVKSADDRKILTHTSVKNSILQSSKSVILPNVYHSEESDSQRSKVFAESKSFQDIKEIDLLSFLEILQIHDKNSATVGPMNNGIIDAYEIKLTGDEDEDLMMKVIASMNSESLITFAAVEEPTQYSILPSNNGHFSRVLSNTSATNPDGVGIFYKPEGSEYSIYYADTYLYITPDIFTGLMTGIFVFFVLLTGYSCLGAIQGNSIYPSKLPVLGREA